MYIILDIETTGLIPKDGSNNFYNYKILDKYENCRMLQICYEILDSNLNVMTTKSFYINEIDNKLHLESIKEIPKSIWKKLEN